LAAIHSIGLTGGACVLSVPLRVLPGHSFMAMVLSIT